ncbi:MAG: biopolymer transporter ExbD [Cyanobacteria bacterium RM1_2_2]|nr:biopolymer transporter ExbD [Cyanobacteria bacterium RM1_2_2]
MRFKSQRSNQDLPEVNLVPMMDVLMVVLTFFIIVSMTLTGQQIANVQIPQTDGAGIKKSNEDKPALAIGLTTNNEIILEDKPIDATQLATAMQEFLTKNPEGVVLLKADRTLDYSRVVQLLKTMRDIGGDRVSLAIEQQQESVD